jgi:ClpP class serine protease
MTAAVRRMIAVRDRAGVEVEAVAEERATSAAFALMLVGNRAHVPARGRTASIGTVIVRKPMEGAEGVEVFRSGERKMRPNAIEPLNKEDREDLQSIVDDFAIEFATLVAEYRGKTADHWLSLRGASLSGEAALEAGLVDSNQNAHEVIEMALSDAARAEIAEAAGLSASASEAEIKARIQENRAAASELAAVKAQLATVEADKLALEERQAREKAAQEATQKRAVFAAEVEKACTEGLITPPRVAGLLAHYDAHGEASARATFGLVKADKPLVPPVKVGAAPEVSSSTTVLTPEQIEHAKTLGVDPALYAAHMAGGAKGGV